MVVELVVEVGHGPVGAIGDSLAEGGGEAVGEVDVQVGVEVLGLGCLVGVGARRLRPRCRRSKLLSGTAACGISRLSACPLPLPGTTPDPASGLRISDSLGCRVRTSTAARCPWSPSPAPG